MLNDADDAERIARCAPNTDRGDATFLIETLSRRDDGEYLLHCEGRAATKYSQRSLGEETGGEKLWRFAEDQALAWCERWSIDREIVVRESDDRNDLWLIAALPQFTDHQGEWQ